MSRRDNLKNKRTFTWNDHHEVRLVFTEVFTKTEEYEQEQGYGGEEEERRKQIISPKQSSSSIYSLKNKTKTIDRKSLNKQVSPHQMVFNRGEKRLEKEFAFSKTSTWQSVTFKSQISQMETNGHKQNKNKWSHQKM